MKTLQIARELNKTPMAALAADRLLDHVANGGFLGANADHYAFGVIAKDGKVVKSGFDCFSEEDRAAAVEIATTVNPHLWEEAEDNFHSLANDNF